MAVCGVISMSPLTVAAQTNAEQVLAIGRNVLSMEDYMLAIQYFNQAIKAKPYLADPYFFRALAKLSLDDYKGAEADCSLAIERNKFKTEAYKVRGFARQFLGKPEEAIADFNIGLEYNPIDKYFLFYKAVAQTEIKAYESADTTFSTLLRQYPKFEEGFTARGKLNIEKGDTTAALQDLERSISLSKSFINPYLLRAEIEWKRKEWDKAAEDMGAAIRLRPELPDLYVNRAFIRYNSDDFFGAMSDYNYAIELDPANTPAIYNRALLRYEVKDLPRAEEDLSRVLALEPDNFHALYNRGLVWLEEGKNREALSDFEAITRRFPRFYPVYYAMAEAYRNLGDMKKAMQLVHHADGLVEKYVSNPGKNPLDRPTIAAAESYDSRKSDGAEESETEIMDKFNRLVTVSEASETQLSYNERIKGRVQDRDVHIEPEPSYAISFIEGPASLRSISNYFKELDDLNRQRLISRQFYLSAGLPSGVGEAESEELFRFADELTRLINSGGGRPVDRLALGVTQTLLKNFPDAIQNINAVINDDNCFAVAYMARGYVKYAQALAEAKKKEKGDDKDTFIERQMSHALLTEAIADYDQALSLNPRLVFAWFNKGNIYYAVGDYTSAMQCYTEALNIDKEFGQAFFNRGLAYLQSGNKQQAFSDLSRAGELGIIPSYNILKRMH